MTDEQLERLLLLAAGIGELHFPPDVTTKICRRMAEFAHTIDDGALSDLYDELQAVLADAGAELLRARGAIH